MTPLRLLVVALALVGAHAAIDADRIAKLPGFSDALPSKMYSGYLTVPDRRGNKQYHYVFVEATDADPAKAPVSLWLNGGPGSSSLIGFFTEQGPFTLNADSMPKNSTDVPTLFRNPYGWSAKSSVMWLESPAGVGFSHCEFSPCTANDTSTAEDNHEALKQFFKGFPEFASNDFYITGESYAGIYIPTLAEQIMEDADNEINLVGMAIGNGCWGNKVGTCGGGAESRHIEADFLYGHAAYSDSLRSQIEEHCGDFHKPLSLRCEEALLEMTASVGRYDVYNFYDTCGGEGTMMTADELQSRVFAEQGPREPFGAGGRVGALNDYKCGGTKAMNAYLKHPDVIEALHVKANTAGMFYTQAPAGDLRPLYKQLAEKYRLMIYSGDADGCVPYVGTQRWVTALGFDVVTDWHPWKAASLSSTDSTVAGYTMKFGGPSKDFTFVTIKGAGHMVPEFKPVQSQAMIERFFAHEDL